jgi:murein DD-endopeptidase MepM/ murein hydrolase activator NlpD
MAVAAGAVEIVFPSPNTTLLQGDGPAFYQHVERNFEGKVSYPWQGGQYGMVRSPVRRGGGLAYTQFHEGIDIKPVRRDSRSIPEDPVVSIATGRVAHVNSTASHSNYGIYVVIEHEWDGCKYYSLYAHLREASVHPGATVGKGDKIGTLGWTGRGIDLPRAHVHFELNLLLSEEFEEWHRTYFPKDPNYHGLFNGLNLAGVDAARFLLENTHHPALSLPEFLSKEKPGYRVAVPASRGFTLVKRYPWLAGENRAARPPAWEITFNDLGVPLSATPRGSGVTEPRVVWAAAAPGTLLTRTKGWVGGTTKEPKLTQRGERFMRLIAP